MPWKLCTSLFKITLEPPVSSIALDSLKDPERLRKCWFRALRDEFHIAVLTALTQDRIASIWASNLHFVHVFRLSRLSYDPRLRALNMLHARAIKTWNCTTVTSKNCCTTILNVSIDLHERVQCSGNWTYNLKFLSQNNGSEKLVWL